MMHGIPSGAASSWQGAACPSIHEHCQWAPQATEDDVILPIEPFSSRTMIASFLRHCNTMESPPNPGYLYGGPQPVDDIQDLQKEASMESLVELQGYLERLQFEATCLRLWSNGIQDQITEWPGCPAIWVGTSRDQKTIVQENFEQIFRSLLYPFVSRNRWGKVRTKDVLPP